MSGYAASSFEEDAVRTARSLHLAYRRCQFVLARWYGGMNAEFPNKDDTIPMNNLMSRAAEFVADYESGGSAKLNTVLAKSDLRLPGDV